MRADGAARRTVRRGGGARADSSAPGGAGRAGARAGGVSEVQGRAAGSKKPALKEGRKRGGAAFHGEAGLLFACGGRGEGGRGALDRKHLPGAQAQRRAVLHGVAAGRAGSWAGDVSEVQGRAAGSKKPAP